PLLYNLFPYTTLFRSSVIPLPKLWKEYNRIIKDNGAILLTSSGMFTAELMMSNPNMYKYKIIWEKSKATNFLNAKKQPLRKYEEDRKSTRLNSSHVSI